jgi:hypothetical protein
MVDKNYTQKIKIKKISIVMYKETSLANTLVRLDSHSTFK